MPRARAPLTFGAGIDRATGAGVRDPRSLEDGLNVVATEARLDLRAALTGTGLPSLAWGTDILAQMSVEKSKDILQVVYDRVSRDVRVYRVNPLTTPTRQNVGTWGTLNASASFPIITMAEAGGVVYLAHAEEVMAYRLVTKYWSPGALDTDAGTLTSASGDLDNSGAAGDIYFFAVAAHKEYIVGMGWGTEASASTKDKPNIVRLSKPDDPTKWPPESYFLCGSSSSRILAAASMADGLLCASSYQRYTITGSDPETFGVQLTDPNFGIVSPRAFGVAEGRAYSWSSTGPRITRNSNAPSEDLGVELDLLEAVPSDWPTPGPRREIFTALDVEPRVLYFLFPDLTSSTATTTFAWATSLRSSTERFTPAAFKRRLACAGRYITDKATPPSGLAYASSLSLTDAAWNVGEMGRRLTVSWTNNSYTGSETVEVWLKAGSGAWALRTSAAVSGATQSTVLTGLDALTTYSVAIRHRTAVGGYTSGYAFSTPDAWVAGTAAGAKANATTGAGTPALTGGTWSRTGASSSEYPFSIGFTDRRCTLEVQANNGSGWVTIYSDIPATAGWSIVYSVLEANVGGTVTFRARLVNGATVGSWSGTLTGSMMLTDVAPTFGTILEGSGATYREIELWLTTPNEVTLQLQEQETGLTLTQTTVYPLGLVTRRVRSTNTGSGTMTVRARVARTSFGVTDYGPWGSYTTPFTCTPGGTDPDLPYLLDFYPSRGNFGTAPFGSRTRPRTLTSTDVPTANDQLWVLFQVGFGAGVDIAPVVVTSASYLATISIGGSGGYFYAWTFKVDLTTMRRGDVTPLEY